MSVSNMGGSNTGGEVAPFLKGQTTDSHSIGSMEKGETYTALELDKKQLIHPKSVHKNLLAAYRELRTKLFKRTENKNFVCMVSSVCREGGGSLVASNLAASIAMDKTKTAIVVDCDLYSQKLEQIFELPVYEGITDYLGNEDVDIESIIQKTGIDRLRAISVGSLYETGAEYFSTEKMTQFLDAIKSRYPDRYIIINAPPIGTTPEARILGHLCDFSVVVVPYGKVNNQDLQLCVEAVGEDKLAGVVFNE